MSRRGFKLWAPQFIAWCVLQDDLSHMVDIADDDDLGELRRLRRAVEMLETEEDFLNGHAPG